MVSYLVVGRNTMSCVGVIDLVDGQLTIQGAARDEDHRDRREA
jgi:hypothetical protein